MQSKTGVLMFQFEYLNTQKISGLQEFLDKFEAFTKELDTRYHYGIEIRNPNFLKRPFFDFLHRNNLAMVFLQGYYMPPIWDVYSEFESSIGSPVVFRLHGPDRAGMEKRTNNIWDQIIEPRDADLARVRELIIALQLKDIDVYVNVNNHFEGSAPLTIKRIVDGLNA